MLTAALLDPAADAGAKVETVATTHVRDGLWMDGKGYRFITSPAINGVRMRASDSAGSGVCNRARW